MVERRIISGRLNTQTRDGAAVCRLSYSRSALATRRCHPSPLSRKRLTTSRERRMAIRPLVGVFCAPRIFLISSLGSTSAAGRPGASEVPRTPLGIISIEPFRVYFALACHIVSPRVCWPDGSSPVRSAQMRATSEHGPGSCRASAAPFTRVWNASVAATAADAGETLIVLWTDSPW